MNATIVTTKEEVDHQFWYPKRNKVIQDYKYIKDSYSWDDEFEIESESAKSINSPKIYDLRTPQKKSKITEMMLDATSDKLFTDKHEKRILNSKPIKSTTSTKLVSIPTSKHTDVSLVDLILLEESSRDKHSKTGTVIKLKDCKKTLIVEGLSTRLNDTLLFPSRKKLLKQ